MHRRQNEILLNLNRVSIPELLQFHHRCANKNWKARRGHNVQLGIASILQYLAAVSGYDLRRFFFKQISRTFPQRLASIFGN
jgi:hypothetical protein